MSVKSADYIGGGVISTARGPSPLIWGQNGIDVERALEHPEGVAGYFYDDFTDSLPGAVVVNTADSAIGRWTGFLGNNAAVKIGTAADTTNLPLEGGVLGLTAGSNNNLTISMAAQPPTYRLTNGATGFPLMGKLAFETSIAVSAVASGNFDLFVGLMDMGESGTRITSAADLVFSAANTIKTASGMGACLGFWKRATTNPADVAIVHNVNNGTAQVLGGSTNIQKLSLNYATNDPAHAAAGQVMAALSVTSGIAKAIGDSTGGCFLKLGFIFDPTPPTPRNVATALTGQTAGAIVKPLVRFFVNGKELPIFYDSNIVQASTFPATFMAPVIGFRSGGTGAGVAYVDFVRCLQLGTI